MKKLIALGISIAILISAFVLLPKQKHENVIAGEAGGKNAKVESLVELKNLLMSLTGLQEGITSGTITFSYSTNATTSESSYDGGEYMFNTSEHEYDCYLANEKSDIGALSDQSFGSGTLGSLSDSNISTGTDLPLDDSNDIIQSDGNISIGGEIGGDITIGGGEGGITVNPDIENEIKDQYQDEIENEVNNSISNIMDTLSIGITSNSVDLKVFFDDGIIYYQLKGTYAARAGSGEDKKVLTFVYDIELYADIKDATDPYDDEVLVRFNFFDGYSNNSKFAPVITADKLDVWYEADEDAIEYINALFGEFNVMINQIAYVDQFSYDMIDGDVYMSNYSEDGYNAEFEVNLSDKENPRVYMYSHSEENDYVHGHTQTVNSDSSLSFSNIDNTKIEFDLDKVDVQKARDFDWDFFEDLYGFFSEDEEGGNN